MRSKRELAVALSQLKEFDQPLMEFEQYNTPGEIAADWIWQAAFLGDIAGKVILDAGCGPGILGIGALLMGAKKVYFLDKNEHSIEICQENLTFVRENFGKSESSLVHEDVSLFDEQVDVVLQNPPFGTKVKHSDKKFLEKAFSVGKIVYTMHKWSTKSFVEAISADHGFIIDHVWRYEFPIKWQFKHHKKPKVRVDVGLWRMVKKS